MSCLYPLFTILSVRGIALGDKPYVVFAYLLQAQSLLASSRGISKVIIFIINNNNNYFYFYLLIIFFVYISSAILFPSLPSMNPLPIPLPFASKRVLPHPIPPTSTI